MKPIIQLHDKQFEIFIKQEIIEDKIRQMAQQISKDYEGKCPIFLAILNGSFLFAAELMKSVSIDCEITFLRVSSYHSTTSTGKITEVLGLKEDITDRDVIILEDIIDTGLTMAKIQEQLLGKNPKSLKVASLFQKPEALKTPIDIAYLGFELENRFVLGYGLDYDGLGRNLPDLYVLHEA